MFSIDPGGEGGTSKRFDARMSPAHARLVMLASEMDKGGGNGASYQQQSGGSGGFTASPMNDPSMDVWNIQDSNRDDFNFEDELANWDKHSQIRNERLSQHARKAPVGGKWSKVEDDQLKTIVEKNGPRNWKNIAELLGPTRSDVQCLHRWNKVLKPGLLKVIIRFSLKKKKATTSPMYIYDIITSHMCTHRDHGLKRRMR